MKVSSRTIALCAIVAFTALMAGASLAADLPSRKAAPAIVPIDLTWTGPYLGINAGYAWTREPAQLLGVSAGEMLLPGQVPTFVPVGAAAPAVARLNSSGFIGGAQVGYNYQLGRFVVGVEGDFDALAGSRRKQTFIVPTALGGVTASQVGREFDWYASVRPRAGFLLTPALLVYGTGGVAFAHTTRDVMAFSSSAAAFNNGQGEHKDVFTGWVVGGGVEWKFAQDWSAKVEYLHSDFGKHTLGVNGVLYGQNLASYAGQQLLVRQNVRLNQVRVGLNWHFDTASLFNGAAR